jgi:nucleoside-diphosphate-sugar epimerase
LSSFLILGAGYMGAALAEVALEQDHEVTLADNWYLTEQGKLTELEREGARIETADIRNAGDLDRLLSQQPDRVYLLAAQASRVVAASDPDYTESTNVTGPRRVAEALARPGSPQLVYASSLNVYGPDLKGSVATEHPYGPQRDLAHLSKIWGELCLAMYAREHGFDLAILRFGIVYGPSLVEHSKPENQTVVDKFCRLTVAGEELPLDDGGRATIGVVHVEDAACIMLDSPGEPGVTASNVAAETVTVADIAALARGEESTGTPVFRFETPFDYRHRLADYMNRVCGASSA